MGVKLKFLGIIDLTDIVKDDKPNAIGYRNHISTPPFIKEEYLYDLIFQHYHKANKKLKRILK